MNDETKTEAQLIDELAHLRQRVADLEAADAKRKLAEQTLRKSEEFYRIMMENISDPIFLTDDDGNFVFICPNVRHILGYPIEQIEAMGNISALISDRQFDLEELKTQGEIRDIERVITDKAGRERLFLVTAKRTSIKGGTILFTCHDITERKQIEEELKQLNTELTAIHAIAATVGQSLELDQIVNAALDKVLELTGAVAGRIELYDNGNSQNDRMIGLVVEREIDPAEAVEKRDWVGLDIPIKAQDKVLGQLALFNRSPYQWQAQEAHLLTTIGYEMGMGIANARLVERHRGHATDHKGVSRRPDCHPLDAGLKRANLSGLLLVLDGLGGLPLEPSGQTESDLWTG